jgi:hypothetical protein
MPLDAARDALIALQGQLAVVLMAQNSALAERSTAVNTMPTSRPCATPSPETPGCHTSRTPHNPARQRSRNASNHNATVPA